MAARVWAPRGATAPRIDSSRNEMSFRPRSTARSVAVTPRTLTAFRSAPRLMASRTAAMSPRFTPSNMASFGAMSVGGRCGAAAWPGRAPGMAGGAAGSPGRGLTVRRLAPAVALPEETSCAVAGDAARSSGSVTIPADKTIERVWRQERTVFIGLFYLGPGPLANRQPTWHGRFIVTGSWPIDVIRRIGLPPPAPKAAVGARWPIVGERPTSGRSLGEG